MAHAADLTQRVEQGKAEIASLDKLQDIKQQQAYFDEKAKGIEALEKAGIPIREIEPAPPYLAPPEVAIPDRPIPRPTALGSLFAAVAGIVAPESAGAIAASNLKGAIDSAAQAYQDALTKRQMVLEAALRKWESLKDHLQTLHEFAQARKDATFQQQLQKLQFDEALNDARAQAKALGIAENLENARGIKQRELAERIAALETATAIRDWLRDNLGYYRELGLAQMKYGQDLKLKWLQMLQDLVKLKAQEEARRDTAHVQADERIRVAYATQPLALQRIAYGQALTGQRQITVGETLARNRGQSRGVDLKGKSAADTALGGLTKAFAGLQDTRTALGIVRAKDTDPGAPEFARIQRAEMAADGAINVFVQKVISFMRGNIQKIGPSAVTVNADALRDYGQRLAALMAQGQIPPYDFARAMTALVSNAKALNLIPKVWNLPTFSEGELQMMTERLMPALRDRDTNIPYQHLMQMLSTDPSQWDSILAGYQSQPMKNVMKKIATLYHEMALGAPVPGTAQAQAEGLSKEAINAIRTSLGAPPIK
jgi:hypothetical protein